MKKKSLITSITILASCASVNNALADGNSDNDRQTRDNAQSHFFLRASQPIVAARANQLLGREIFDTSGHKLGKVRELALDLQNGRVAEVIVGTGGFLGIKEKDAAVPPSEFSWDPDAKKLTCQLDPEQLRNVPTFDLAQWSDSVAPEKVRANYRRYGITTYFIDDSVSTPVPSEVKAAEQLTSAGMAAPMVHLGPITRVKDLMGEAVDDPQNEHIGRVENVIVDLTAGRIVVLTVSTGEFLGMGNEVSAVPAQAFHQGPNVKTLRLNTTREALRTVPHFQADEWQLFGSPTRVATIYNAYDLPPYQNMPPTAAQNVRERSDNSFLAQGISTSDQAITARIRRDIMSRPDLSADAENVKIITLDGQVTLRGPVRNQQEEQAIIDIARNAVAANGKVTNQIETINQSLKPADAPANNDLK